MYNVFGVILEDALGEPLEPRDELTRQLGEVLGGPLGQQMIGLMIGP